MTQFTSVALSDDHVHATFRRESGWPVGSSWLSDDDFVVLGRVQTLALSAASRHVIEIVRSQLAPLAELGHGWDSYGSPPIGPDVLSAVADFLVEVILGRLPTPYVVPTSAGGLSLEWHRGPKELSVEFLPGAATIDAFFSDVSSGLEWEMPFPAKGMFLPALAGMQD